MMQFGLIGIGAGAAAALLFASVTSGSLLSVLLFYLAPLPMMIAGLGWSHWSALIGALAGALALAAMFGPVFFFAFLASAGLPAWWLTYLAMLARPVATGGNGGAPALEWYPPGRLVMWAAILAALVVRRRHSQFRHRRGKFPRRHAPGAGPLAAGGNRRAGGRAPERARRIQ